MKGMTGIVVAVALGVVAAMCNWLYLTRQAQDYERVSFVLISPATQINPGDRFKESHFERVDLPETYLGNLDQIAVRWRDLDTVVGEVATKSYTGNELLLREDLKTPPQREVSELLAEDEVLRWVPVDQRTFAPDHINPGDLVKFVVVTPTGLTAQRNNQAQPLSETSEFGPFEILTLGNRRGRKEILKSRGGSVGQENLIGIRVRESAESGAEADRLFAALHRTGNQGVQVVLLSARKTAP